MTRLHAQVAKDVCAALGSLIDELETPMPGDLPFRPPVPHVFEDPRIFEMERMRVTPRAFLPFPAPLPSALQTVQSALAHEPALAWRLESARILCKQRLDLRLDDPISTWLDQQRELHGARGDSPREGGLAEALALVDAVATHWLRAAFLRRIVKAAQTPRTQAAVSRFRQRVLASAGPREQIQALCLDDPTLERAAATILVRAGDPGMAADAFRELLIAEATQTAREQRRSPLTPWRLVLMFFVLSLFVLLFSR